MSSKPKAMEDAHHAPELDKRARFWSADIMLHIQGFLDPMDLLSLRKTSRAFYLVSKNRHVWVNCAERILERNGLSKRLFPLQEMSLSDLEHLAFLPGRFIRYMRRHNGARVRPPLSWSIIPQPEDNVIRKVYLVPGGRFLFTVGRRSGIEIDVIGLWDLGFGECPLKVAPIAQMTLPTGNSYASELVLAPDGERVLMFGMVENIITSTQSAMIYEIDPKAPKLVFQVKGQIDGFSLETIAIGIYGDNRVITLDQHENFAVMTVWNYCDRTASSWRIVGSQDMQVFMFKNTVVTLTQRPVLLQIFDIPPMQDMDSLDEIVTNPPKWSINRLHNAYNKTAFMYSPPGIDKTGHQDHIALIDGAIPDDFTDDDRIPVPAVGQTGWVIDLYSMTPVNMGNDSDVPSMLPTFTGSVGNFTDDLWRHSLPVISYLDFLAYSESHFFFHSMQHRRGSDDRVVVVTALPIPTTRQDSIDNFSISVDPDNGDAELRPEQFTVDPFSGRMVVVARNNVEDTAQSEIRIMDVLCSSSHYQPPLT